MDQPMGQPIVQQIQIKADDQTLKGVYSNAANFAHTENEFVFEFLNIFPPQGSLVSRIITSPPHAKMILQALKENIQNYEKQFGVIKAAKQEEQNIGFQQN
jgi:hypothetical protein